MIDHSRVVSCARTREWLWSLWTPQPLTGAAPYTPSGSPAAAHNAVNQIPGSRELVMSAATRAHSVNDRPLLQHLGGLIARELEHDAAQRDRR